MGRRLCDSANGWSVSPLSCPDVLPRVAWQPSGEIVGSPMQTPDVASAFVGAVPCSLSCSCSSFVWMRNCCAFYKRRSSWVNDRSFIWPLLYTYSVSKCWYARQAMLENIDSVGLLSLLFTSNTSERIYEYMYTYKILCTSYDTRLVS